MQFQPLLWVCLADCNNGCILFSQGSRLQAPGGQETVNKPQLAASPGVTQQPGCVFFFFFLVTRGQDSRWGWMWQQVLKEKELCVCVFVRDYAAGLTSRRLCKWCCGPKGSMVTPSPEPICSTSSWTLFSSRMPLVLAKFWRCCRNATRPESTDESPQNRVSIDLCTWSIESLFFFFFNFHNRKSKFRAFLRARLSSHWRKQAGWLVSAFHSPYEHCACMHVTSCGSCAFVYAHIWQHLRVSACVCVTASSWDKTHPVVTSCGCER